MSQSMQPEPGLRQQARQGVFWAAVQSWGNKIFTVLLSVVLARLLSPEEFGIASAVWLALLLVPLIADLGIGTAILQRRDLRDADVNLPFYVSCGLALVLVTGIVAFRAPLADWAGLGDRTIYLVAIAVTLLVSVPTAFQEAMYKRHMRFRDLALRAFAANICGGFAALAAAIAGFGVWSFVVQAYVSLGINVVWIWARPAWLPGLGLEGRSFAQMLRFGLPVLAQRLVDFAGTRVLDLVIISQIGLAAYGLYVVGGRLYQTLMQLLQSAFFDVSLTVLSTVSEDRPRIAAIYGKTIALSAGLLSPCFVALAAIAPEVCAVLFGPDWAGVEDVAQPLLLLGAVQCVQYMNGAFLSARGRPELILVTGVAKSALQILAVLAIGAPDVAGLTWIYVGATLMVTPLSFAMTGRELGLRATDILPPLARPAFYAAVGFAAVQSTRPVLAEAGLSAFATGLALGLLFAVVYLALLALLDRSQLIAIRDQLRRRR